MLGTYAHSAAGARLFFLSFLDTDGLPIGSTRARPATGTSTNGGPLRWLMPKSASPIARPAPNIVLSTGEDGSVQHRYIFDSDNTQATTVTLAADELALSGVLQNMPVKAYAGGRFGYAGIAGAQLPDVCIIHQNRTIRVSDGAQLWGGVVIPRASLTYRGQDGFNERGAATYTYDYTPQPSAYDFGGVTILDADGVQKQADTLPFENLPYPVFIQGFTGNGSETTFNLDYPPIDKDSVEVFVNSPVETVHAAEQVSVDSVSTVVPYSVTLDAPPADLARGVILAQFRP